MLQVTCALVVLASGSVDTWSQAEDGPEWAKHFELRWFGEAAQRARLATSPWIGELQAPAHPSSLAQLERTYAAKLAIVHSKLDRHGKVPPSGLLEGAKYSLMSGQKVSTPLFDGGLQPASSVAPEAAKGYAIPYQLFLTSAFADATRLPPSVRDNVQKIINLNPGITVVWFDNKACEGFLAEGFPLLAEHFKNVKHGPYKSDICRTTWLMKNGGWYIDLDLDIRQLFLNMVEPGTTFTSAWSTQGQVLNAIMGAAPNSKIMIDSVGWFESSNGIQGCSAGSTTCGTVALKVGLEEFAGHCGEFHHMRRDTSPDDHGCGEMVRMLKEVDMADPAQRLEATESDPGVVERAIEGRDGVKNFRGRTNAAQHFRGLDYALIYTGRPSVWFGYSRFDGCHDWGCEQNPLGVHDRNIDTFLQEDTKQIAQLKLSASSMRLDATRKRIDAKRALLEEKIAKSQQRDSVSSFASPVEPQLVELRRAG